MKHIRPPEKLPGTYARTIFLAGSIEMGAAEFWQDKVAAMFLDTDAVILNPRRADWNASWEQSINNPQFREQVEWELDALERASVIIMFFDPTTKSPISLLELGLFGKESFRASRMIVCCPHGFWRKGNVDIVCKRYRIPMAETLADAVAEVKRMLF